MGFPASILLGLPNGSQLRFKDVCKRDMKGAQINADTWEALAKDRDTWHHKAKEGVHCAEQTARNQMASKGAARKERAASAHTPSTFVCPECNKDCHSRIGLHSHSRRCALPPRYTIAFRDEDATTATTTTQWFTSTHLYIWVKRHNVK